MDIQTGSLLQHACTNSRHKQENARGRGPSGPRARLNADGTPDPHAGADSTDPAVHVEVYLR